MITSILSDKIHICLSIHWKPVFEYYTFWIFEVELGFLFDKVLANVDNRWAGGSDEKWTTTDEYKSC